MKVLVADDDAIIRKLLQSFLIKWKYEVEVAENGTVAWNILQQNSPPNIAILDWMMPGLSGPDLCAKIRKYAPDKRTFVIILSAKREKDDIVMGLDAGADDYLTKPFHPAELQSRLRVAERILNYERDLQQHIKEMELLLRRHNLLGEILERQQNVPLPNLTPVNPQNVARSAFDQKLTALIPAGDMGNIVQGTLEQRGVHGATLVPTPPDELLHKPFYIAWAPVVFLDEGVWLDVLMEVELPAGRAFFQQVLNRPPNSNDEVLDNLAETVSQLQNTLKCTWLKLGIEVLAPMIPRAITFETFNLIPQTAKPNYRLVYKIDGFPVIFSFFAQPAPTLKKEIKNLKALDILAETLSPPDNPNVVLLNKGVTLNLRYISKIGELAGANVATVTVPVVEPSRLTRFLRSA